MKKLLLFLLFCAISTPSFAREEYKKYDFEKMKSFITFAKESNYELEFDRFVCSAAYYNDKQMFDFLLKQHPNVNTECDHNYSKSSLLEFAISRNATDIAIRLIELGANIDTKNYSAFAQAILKKNKKLITFFQQNKKFAPKYNGAYLVEYETSDRDSYWLTPVLAAIASGDYDLFTSLLSKGVKISDRLPEQEKADYPVLLAIIGGNVRIMEYLLKNKYKLTADIVQTSMYVSLSDIDKGFDYNKDTQGLTKEMKAYLQKAGFAKILNKDTSNE